MWSFYRSIIGAVAIELLCGGVLFNLPVSSAAEIAPPSPEEFVRRQTDARAVAAKTIASVVAIQQSIPAAGGPPHHMPCGSGVIISPEGLILSQYHVSHMLDPTSSDRSRKPGERAKIILSNGHEQEAELLGADLSFDLSLLRLVNPGPYPYSQLDEKGTVQLGDFVLKLGHPLGYRVGREPVVRIGRVLCQQDDSFVSDCLMNGGDSGGPLFDLTGRLVGVVRGGLTNHPLRPSSRSGMLFTCSTNVVIQARLESMRKGEITLATEELVTGSMTRLQQARSLPADQWSQGNDVRQLLRDVVAEAGKSVVHIKDGSEAVILGTVVGADGWIVTKASELPAEPVCELRDRRTLSAEVVGIDHAYDLALLKVAATDLRPVIWNDNAAYPPVGTILAVPDSDGAPLAWGIVSVACRDLKGPFPTKIISARQPKAKAALPEITGKQVEGRGYRVENVAGTAASAGIQPGDVLLTIGGKPIQTKLDLGAFIEGHRAGESVAVRLIRAGNTQELTLILPGKRPSRFSTRNDDFPTVFEHDAPLVRQECGGPVVGLDGKALGITIASVSAHGCMAIPGDRVRGLLQKMKSGGIKPRQIP